MRRWRTTPTKRTCAKRFDSPLSFRPFLPRLPPFERPGADSAAQRRQLRRQLSLYAQRGEAGPVRRAHAGRRADAPRRAWNERFDLLGAGHLRDPVRYYAAVTSALGTLKGPLHGGANAIVRAMLEEIKAPENAERYVKETLAGDRVVPGLAPKRIPGFGHRVYTSYDPRAAVLHEMSETLGKRAGETVWVDISEDGCGGVREGGSLRERRLSERRFLLGVRLHTMGIDVPLFTPCLRWRASGLDGAHH